MEDGNRTDAASTSKSHGGSIHLQSMASPLSFQIQLVNYNQLTECFVLGLKNEDTYEIAIPYEENSFEQQGFFTQNDQNFDGKS